MLTRDGSPDLKIGETWASFQDDGKTPFDNDKLNNEDNGLEISFESSRRILLFIPSGPHALPSGKPLSTDETSKGEITKELIPGKSEDCGSVKTGADNAKIVVEEIRFRFCIIYDICA